MQAPASLVALHGDFPEKPKNTDLSLNFVDDDGNVYLHGRFDESITSHVFSRLVKQIEDKKKLKEAKISMYINSYGGYTMYAYDLLGLMERAKALGIIVETYVYGVAFSCGSLIASAGTKGHRFIGPYAEHLCHLGYTSMYAKTDLQLERESSSSKDHFNKVRAIYKKYAKIPNLDRVLRDDNYLIRGEDIIRKGLADKLV